MQEFEKEVNILATLRHNNILNFLGYSSTFPNLAIVTEYCERGSLYNVLHKKKEPINWKSRLSIALDISRGMNYLHSKSIIHRDLKVSVTHALVCSESSVVADRLPSR